MVTKRKHTAASSSRYALALVLVAVLFPQPAHTANPKKSFAGEDTLSAQGAQTADAFFPAPVTNTITARSVTELPTAEAAPAPTASPLRIYIPNPAALKNAAEAASIAVLDSQLGREGTPGTGSPIGNTDNDTPPITLPTVSVDAGAENTSRYGALNARTSEAPASSIEKTINKLATPFTVAIAAVGSVLDNTKTVITTMASQVTQEAVQIAQASAPQQKPVQVAAAEPTRKAKPKAPRAVAAPAPQPQPESGDVALAAAEAAPAPQYAAHTEPAPTYIPPAPTYAPNEFVAPALPVPASDLADAMPTAPGQTLAEGPILSTGPLIQYSSAQADFTQAQEATEMAQLIPAAGAEGMPMDTSPGAYAPPGALIPPTATQTAPIAAGIASETPVPISAPPAKSEATIAITETNPLPADTKNTLEKTPAGITSKRKIARSKNPVNIERGKNTESESSSEADKVASAMSVQNPMNIKVNTRQPGLDLNYELESAYNALISGNTEAAIERYSMVLANDVNNKNALFGLATTYHRLGQISKARGLYSRLLKLDPAHRDGLNNYLALAAEEAPQEALTELLSLETRNPDFSPIPAQMAVIYQRMGQTDQALEKMSRAVALAPDNITYRYNLAILFDRAGKYRDAADLYRQIIDASYKGENVSADLSKIQQRLTFLNANNP